MRFTFLVAGIVTFSMLSSQTEAIQFDEVDAYGYDQFAQLDAIPPQEKPKKVAAPVTRTMQIPAAKKDGGGSTKAKPAAKPVTKSAAAAPAKGGDCNAMRKAANACEEKAKK